MIDFEKIARVCHEANRAYCKTIGDRSQPPWEQAPEWQKKSAIEGVKFRLNNPGAPASASHDSWSAQKIADGWVYGETKDPEAKTHPCLVPFENLPDEQRMKDFLFAAIADRMILGVAERELSPKAMHEIPVDAVRQLGCKGVVLLVQNHDGTCGISGHGLNHHQNNQLLSLGIHLNLKDHDEKVLAGAAGREAQTRAATMNGGARA